MTLPLLLLGAALLGAVSLALVLIGRQRQWWGCRHRWKWWDDRHRVCRRCGERQRWHRLYNRWEVEP